MKTPSDASRFGSSKPSDLAGVSFGPTIKRITGPAVGKGWVKGPTGPGDATNWTDSEWAAWVAGQPANMASERKAIDNEPHKQETGKPAPAIETDSQISANVTDAKGDCGDQASDEDDMSELPQDKYNMYLPIVQLLCSSPGEESQIFQPGMSLLSAEEDTQFKKWNLEVINTKKPVVPSLPLSTLQHSAATSDAYAALAGEMCGDEPDPQAESTTFGTSDATEYSYRLRSDVSGIPTPRDGKAVAALKELDEDASWFSLGGWPQWVLK
mmetsp:Transcript_155864/g.286938  ORF Transcript_155864/g.286938 Transcript_155864/m.286938 type:complete len:269 (-) Transcript_155864:199-1005(-)